jgi:cyclohexanecarboxylate-CoA ligase
MPPSPHVMQQNIDSGSWYAADARSGARLALADGARRSPERALVSDGRRVASYGEIADRVDRAAHGFLRRGVQAGDRVMVQLPNWHEALVAHFALESIGAITLPVPLIFRSNEIRQIIDLCDPVMAIVPRSFAKRELLLEYSQLQPGTSLRQVIAVDRDVPGSGDTFDSLCSERPERSYVGALRDPNEVVEIAFTSGSTGEPKGVVHTANTLHAEHRAWLTGAQLGEADVFFMPSTVGHQIGFTVLRATALAGARIVLMDRWSPEEALSVIAAQGVTFTLTTPAFLYDVLRALGSDHDTRTLKTWILAGQVVTSALREECRRMSHVRFTHLFGMTEMGCTIMNLLDPPAAKVLATGRPLRQVEVRIIDQDGRVLPPGSEGELVIRAPSLLVEYHRRPEVTAASYTSDGFFRTGDQARLDEDGYTWITGRIKELVKRGGENISPVELEEVIASHPKVQEVAVIGFPDERLGERACACVIPRSGETVSLEELLVLFRERGIAKQKWPEQLLIVDSLPRTSIGKVHRASLRSSVLRQSGT